MTNDKLILTDCDGVLVSWDWAFKVSMQEQGYTLAHNGHMSYELHKNFNELAVEDTMAAVQKFNQSAAIGFLPACRDSTYYVKKLHEEHGYRFRVITSLSLDKNAKKLREMNLNKLFGDAIEQVICLDTGADKDQALAPYKGSGLFWIEDRYENAQCGHALGLRSILVEHGYNFHHTPEYPVVKNWKEIYDIVSKSDT